MKDYIKMFIIRVLITLSVIVICFVSFGDNHLLFGTCLGFCIALILGHMLSLFEGYRIYRIVKRYSYLENAPTKPFPRMKGYDQ